MRLDAGVNASTELKNWLEVTGGVGSEKGSGQVAAGMNFKAGGIHVSKFVVKLQPDNRSLGMIFTVGPEKVLSTGRLGHG